MDNIKEALIMRGIAATIQTMKFPTLESINTVLDHSGYMVIDMSKFTFYAFEKHFKSYNEALTYSSQTIMSKNLSGKPEMYISIHNNN